MEDKMEMFQVMEEYEEKLNDALTTTSDNFLFQVNHGIKVLLRGSAKEFIKNVQQIMKKETVYMIRSLNIEFADLEFEGNEDIDEKPPLFTFDKNQINSTFYQEYDLNKKSQIHIERAFNNAVDQLDHEGGIDREHINTLQNPLLDEDISLDVKDLFVLKGDEFEEDQKPILPLQEDMTIEEPLSPLTRGRKLSKRGELESSQLESTLPLQNGSSTPPSMPSIPAQAFHYVCNEGDCKEIECLGRKLFVSHCMGVHNMSKKDCIQIALRQVSRKKELRKRMRPVKPVTCKECNKVFKGVNCARALRKHKRTHGDPQEQCENCEQRFRYKEQLKNHQILVHEGRPLDGGYCELCNKHMNPRSLANHMEVLHGNNQFPCEMTNCNKVMKSLIALRTHSRLCDKTEMCEECGKIFKRKDRLRKHFEIIHEGKKLEEQACDDCGKVVLLKQLSKHKAYAHGNEELPCKDCGKIFKSKPSLKSHEATCNSFEKCDKCGKILGKGSLKYHMLSVHNIGEAKEYRCVYCPAIYYRQKQLKYHVDNKHLEGEKRFICELCPKGFSVRNELALHVDSHNDEKKWSCDMCGNAYKRETHLHRHKKQAHDVEMTDRMMEKERRYMESLAKKESACS